MAVIPVLVRFLGDTKNLIDATTDVASSVERLITQVGAAQQRLLGVATQAANKLTGEYSALRDSIRDFGARNAAILGGVSLSLVGIGSAAVKAASEFQQLEAKLQSFTGSAEAAAESFRKAVEFAATTPFDVKSIVSATAQLEAYGQSGEKNLPLVANLAAASGRPLEELARGVGRSLSGISQGFQSLEETAGVTRQELVRLGARLNSAGGIALKSSGDIEAARNALRKFVEVKFGDAVERQSQTLFGAFSNLGDAITNLAAGFGRELLPAITSITRFIAGLIDRFNNLSEPFRKVIAFSVAGAAGLTALGGAALTLLVPFAGLAAVAVKLLVLGRLQATAAALATKFGVASVASTALASAQTAVAGSSSLSARAITALGAASSAASARIAAFGAATAGARAALSAFLLSPAGLALGALTIAAGVATFAMRRFERQSIETGKAIQKSSQELQFATSSYRQFRDALNTAVESGGGFIGYGKDAATTAREVSEALKTVSPLELQASLERSGISLEASRAALEANRDAADKARDRLRALNSTVRDSSAGFVAVKEQSSEVQAALKEVFGDRTAISAEEFTKALKEANFEFDRLGAAKQVIQGIVGALEQVDPALKSVVTEAKSLDDFLKFAGRSNDIGQLEQSLGLVETKIASVTAKLSELKLPTDAFELAQRLNDPKLGEGQRDAIQAYLALLQQRENLEQRVADNVQQRQNQELASIQQVIDRRRALRTNDLQEEESLIRQKLSIVQAGTQEEIRIIDQLNSNLEAQLKQRADSAGQVLQEQLKSFTAGIQDLKGAGDVGAESFVSAYEKGIVQLKAFALVNRQVLSESPELTRQYTQALEQLNSGLKEANDSVPVEAFERFGEALDSSFDRATTNSQKLALVTKAIADIEKGISAGNFDKESGQQRINQLKSQELSLEQAINAEKRQQVDEIQGLLIQGLEQEIQILEARQAAGEEVDEALRQSREDLLNAKLQIIERERQAEIDATGDVESANQKAALKREQLLKGESLRQYQELQKQEQQLAESLGRQEQLRDNSSRKSGQGGGLEPSKLPDFGAGFGKFGALNSGLGGARAPSSVFTREPPKKPAAPKFSDVQDKVFKSGEGDSDKKSSQPVTQNYNTNFSPNVTMTPEIGELVNKVVAAVVKQVQREKTREGPAGQPGS